MSGILQKSYINGKQSYYIKNIKNKLTSFRVFFYQQVTSKNVGQVQQGAASAEEKKREWNCDLFDELLFDFSFNLSYSQVDIAIVFKRIRGS